MLSRSVLFWEKAYLVDKGIYGLGISLHILFLMPLSSCHFHLNWVKKYKMFCRSFMRSWHCHQVNNCIFKVRYPRCSGYFFICSKKLSENAWHNLKQLTTHNLNLLVSWNFSCAFVCQTSSCLSPWTLWSYYSLKKFGDTKNLGH